MAGQREGGTRSRGLTVRISEQPESGRPIQPEGASTPLEEVRPSMLENLAVSSVRPEYRRQLEMDTQDSEEDFFFRGSRRYPSKGAGAFSSAGRGDERPLGSFSSFRRGAAQPGPPPRQPSRSEPPQQDSREQQWDRSEQSQERGRRKGRSQRSQGDQSRHGAEPPPNQDQRRSSGAGGGVGGYDSYSEDDPGYRPPNRNGSGSGFSGGSGGGSGNRGRRDASFGGSGGAGGAPPPSAESTRRGSLRAFGLPFLGSRDNHD
jgi:hypothetical protein